MFVEDDVKAGPKNAGGIVLSLPVKQGGYCLFEAADAGLCSNPELLDFCEMRFIGDAG